MSDTVKIKVHVSTGKVGSRVGTEIEVDADDWADMDAKERDEMCRDRMFELIEWGYEVVP